MTVLLELAHLVDEHGVPQMQIWRRRVKARFDDQWTTACEFAHQVSLGEDFLRTAAQFGQLLGHGAIDGGKFGRFGHDLRAPRAPGADIAVMRGML